MEAGNGEEEGGGRDVQSDMVSDFSALRKRRQLCHLFFPFPSPAVSSAVRAQKLFYGSRDGRLL